MTDKLITLLGENGEPYNFEVLGVITVGNRDYAILLPENDNGDVACVFRLEKDNQGEDILVEIEDDEELNSVAMAWKELNKEKLN